MKLLFALMLCLICASASAEAPKGETDSGFRVTDDEKSFFDVVLNYRARAHGMSPLQQESLADEYVAALRPFFEKPVQGWDGLIETDGRGKDGRVRVIVKVGGLPIYVANISEGFADDSPEAKMLKQACIGTAVRFSGRFLDAGDEIGGVFNFAFTSLDQPPASACKRS